MDDDEFEWDRDEIVDLDGYGGEATGDPQLDVFGYQTPRDRRNLSGYTPHPVDQAWLANNRADREQRRQRRRAVAQNKAETRQRVQQRKEVGRRQQSAPTPAQDHPAQDHPDREEIVRRSLTELQPGQHGAYFERREVRRWWAPWTKRVVWQQVSSWQMTTPPSGVEVVTVGSTDELDGRVRTIGTVGENGTVVW